MARQWAYTYTESVTYAAPLTVWVRKALSISDRIQCPYWGSVACAHCTLEIPEDCKGNCNRCTLWECPCLSGQRPE